MSNPVQQHYLPKSAYLRFFEIPSKRDFVYFYQRGLDPIIVKVDKIAKERHLYSFVDKNGKYNFEIEAALADLERRATPILTSLNNLGNDAQISGREKGVLSEFITYQAVRTPAFRKSLQDLSSQLSILHLMALAQSKKALANVMEKVKKRKLSDGRAISVDEMQKFILDEEYTVESSGDYYLGQALKLAERIFPCVLIKKFYVFKSEREKFLTCDHPVSLIRNPKLPRI